MINSSKGSLLNVSCPQIHFSEWPLHRAMPGFPSLLICLKKKKKIVFFPSMHFSACLSECLSFHPSGDWGRRILYAQDQFRLQNKKTSSRLAWLGNKMLFQKKKKVLFNYSLISVTIMLSFLVRTTEEIKFNWSKGKTQGNSAILWMTIFFKMSLHK